MITSSPEAGTTLKPNTAVDLVLSLGPQPIQVRDFTGRDADRAEASLESQGLEVDIREEYSDDVRRGLVISQSPDSGELFKGDSVELVVSLGPDLVQVPNVIAYGVEEATRVLEQAGFEVEIRGDDEEVGLGFVIRTDPRAGEMARRGSTITLTLI